MLIFDLIVGAMMDIGRWLRRNNVVVSSVSGSEFKHRAVVKFPRGFVHFVNDVVFEFAVLLLGLFTLEEVFRAEYVLLCFDYLFLSSIFVFSLAYDVVYWLNINYFE